MLVIIYIVDIYLREVENGYDGSIVDLLKEKIETSGIKDLISVDAIMKKDGKQELIKEFQL